MFDRFSSDGPLALDDGFFYSLPWFDIFVKNLDYLLSRNGVLRLDLVLFHP